MILYYIFSYGFRIHEITLIDRKSFTSLHVITNIHIQNGIMAFSSFTLLGFHIKILGSKVAEHNRSVTKSWWAGCFQRSVTFVFYSATLVTFQSSLIYLYSYSPTSRHSLIFEAICFDRMRVSISVHFGSDHF